MTKMRKHLFVPSCLRGECWFRFVRVKDVQEDRGVNARKSVGALGIGLIMLFLPLQGGRGLLSSAHHSHGYRTEQDRACRDPLRRNGRKHNLKKKSPRRRCPCSSGRWSPSNRGATIRTPSGRRRVRSSPLSGAWVTSGRSVSRCRRYAGPDGLYPAFIGRQ
jgi:hypothetical protein